MAKKLKDLSALGKLGIGLAALSLLVSGCGASAASDSANKVAGGPPVATSQADWDTIMKNAKSEGEVVVYTGLAGGEPVWEAFQAAHPDIKIVVERAPSPELIAKQGLEEQSGSHRVDVMFHEQVPWYREQAAAGNFAALQLGAPAQKDGWATMLGQDAYASLVSLPFAIAWNTDTADPVKNVEEIITKHPDAKIGLFDPNVTPGIAYQYKLWADTYGADILDKLAKLDTKTYGSATPMSQDLAAGAIDYALPMTPVLGTLKAENAPVDSKLPEKAVVSLPRVAGIMSSAPHPNASQVFVNWLMGAEGQTALAKKYDPSAARLPGVGEISWDDVNQFEPDTWTNKISEEWIKTEWETRF